MSFWNIDTMFTVCLVIINLNKVLVFKLGEFHMWKSHWISTHFRVNLLKGTFFFFNLLIQCLNSKGLNKLAESIQ